MKFRNGFFCISIILSCVFSSIAVPVFNHISEAALVQRAENVRTLSSAAVRTEDIFAALEVHPLKMVASAEKRAFDAPLLFFSADIAKITCLFCAIKFVQKKFVLSKNKYLKSVIFLQTLQ